MKLVVTLVHGTFARNAAWTKPQSLLSTTLTSTFNGQILLEAFNWSGWNSPVSRFNAAQNLKKRLLQLLVEHPQAKHFIIAHSHGGNVALEALRDRHVAEGMSGVICLSTPFMYVQPRGMRSVLLWFLGSGIWVASFFLLALCTGLVTRWIGLEVSEVSENYLSVALCVVTFPLAYFLPTMWARRAYALLRHMQPTTTPQNRVLLIRSTSDEASLLLIASQFAAFSTNKLISLARTAVVVAFWLFEKTYLLLVGVWKRITFGYDRWANVALMWSSTIYLAVCVTGIIVCATSAFEEFDDTPDFLLLAECAIFSVLTVLYDSETLVRGFTRVLGSFYLGFLGILLIPLWLVMMIVSLFSLGPRLAWHQPFLDVSVDSCPPGEWDVHLLSPLRKRAMDGIWKAFDQPVGDDFRLSHSSPYNDPRALALITQWLINGGHPSSETKSITAQFSDSTNVH